VPRSFGAVGAWYRDFGQTSEDEVVRLLDAARAHRRAAEAREDPGRHQEHPAAAVELRIPCGGVVLEGTLVPPAPGHGVVVFAHGSGSSRRSPRNRHVAHVLDESGLGTLLFDLLTRAEEDDRRLVFDVELLADRLRTVTRWLREHGPGVDADTRIGYFGASTGAAAALIAAALGQDVHAVVSRGGRPDLADQHLAQVRAPTLLIVGSLDTQVLELNRSAQARLTCPSRLEVVPGASHLFEEHGTLAIAADLARRWFLEHLVDEGAQG
jgi:putative phosphoribosyl transferase